MHIFTMYYLEEKQLHVLREDKIIKEGKLNDVEDWRKKKKMKLGGSPKMPEEQNRETTFSQKNSSKEHLNAE